MTELHDLYTANRLVAEARVERDALLAEVEQLRAATDPSRPAPIELEHPDGGRLTIHLPAPPKLVGKVLVGLGGLGFVRVAQGDERGDKTA